MFNTLVKKKETTVNFLKFQTVYSKTTLFHTILAKIVLFMQLFLKMLSGIANNVDPNQTAPSGAV